MFPDQSFAEDGASAVKIFRDLNIIVQERAPKRRKTADYIIEDDSGDLYNQLALLVTGSAEDSPVAVSADSIS